MQDNKLPLLPKAPVSNLQVHVGRSGLAMGDTAQLLRLEDGSIGISAKVSVLVLGLIPWRSLRLIGQLTPEAEAVVGPSLDHGDELRVRIVGLNPEHLAGSRPPEVYISVWGDPRHLTTARGRIRAGMVTA
jgi:hypothetical protein